MPNLTTTLCYYCLAGENSSIVTYSVCAVYVHNYTGMCTASCPVVPVLGKDSVSSLFPRSPIQAYALRIQLVLHGLIVEGDLAFWTTRGAVKHCPAGIGVIENPMLAPNRSRLKSSSLSICMPVSIQFQLFFSEKGDHHGLNNSRVMNEEENRKCS